MKTIKASIVLIIILFMGSVYGQTSDWEYIAEYNLNDVYFLKSSIYRGPYDLVVVALKPRTEMKDDIGNPYKYFTARCTFAKNNLNQVTCIVSSRVFYYEDNTFRKVDVPKVSLLLSNHKILNDLYNRIRQ